MTGSNIGRDPLLTIPRLQRLALKGIAQPHRARYFTQPPKRFAGFSGMKVEPLEGFPRGASVGPALSGWN
jgi:hypothetical protein